MSLRTEPKLAPRARQPRTLHGLLDRDWERLLELSGVQFRRRRFSDTFSPRFSCVVLIRIAERLYARGWRRLAKATSLVNFLVFGIEVPARLEIGAGLVIPHSQGTILGASHVGTDVTIYQQVTLGARLADFDFDASRRPYVSDGATLYAGAKVLGPVRVGERAMIGANAVVLNDVPADTIAVGVPARIVAKKDASTSGQATLGLGS